MKNLILRSLVTMLTLFIFSNIALAQFVWVDDKGVKQFSDQPPPPSVPKSKILKFGGKSMDSQETSTDAGSDTPKKEKAQESISDKEIAYKKRREEMATKQKKADEEAKASAAKSDSCRRMREYKQNLDSGQRIAETDANGNRTILDDNKRTEELNRLNQDLTDCAN